MKCFPDEKIRRRLGTSESQNLGKRPGAQRFEADGPESTEGGKKKAGKRWGGIVTCISKLAR